MYCKELNKKHRFKLLEFEDESIPKNAKDAIFDKIKAKEAEHIMNNIATTDYVVALCIEGKPMTGEELSRHISSKEQQIQGDVTFVIGGSLGLDERVTKRADLKLSFSNMTFPHQLMRVMLLEELTKL